MRFLVIDGCPFPRSIAPYIKILRDDVGESLQSGYRGDDPAARPILHAHGKHTQRELANANASQRAAWGISGTPNQPGRGTHELKSDGVARPGPPGRRLAEWQQPWDAGSNSDADRRRWEAAARRRGWVVEHPYAAGVEGHHAQFAKRPRPRNARQFAQIVRMRRTLPKQ